MDVTQAITVLEQVPVAPPPEATAEISLPLTFLDLLWLHMAPVHRLIFYQHPISKTQFVESVIPTIKKSLSLSLQHYSPLAGRVIVSPENPSPPEIRYVDGDTVPLVIAEANSGEGHFGHLTSNHARSCTEFHPLVPSLPPTSGASDGSVVIPVLALQVTLFPGAGICIGVTNHHGIGDASSIFGFMKAWAFFSSHGDENTSPVSLPAEFRPFCDRTVIGDRKGLGTLFWDDMKNVKVEDTHVHRLPLITDKVRSTFIVTRDNIQMLKNQALARRPDLVHVSSFTMICSHVWSCLVKSRNHTNIEDDEDGYNYFVCAADIRARLDPPIHKNYFGNCVTGCVGRAKTKLLVGEEGFIDAAEVIGESIRNQLYNKEEDGPLRGAEDWLTVFSAMNPNTWLSVASSPKFDYYEVNFGWGKPKKFEVPSIDLSGAMSLSIAKDYEGGMEVGLSLPVTQMDIFTRIFVKGLNVM